MQYTCTRCGKSMDEGQFYTKHGGIKAEMCKKCLTAHIDNFDESTYLWVLQSLDVPFVPVEWSGILQKEIDKKGIEKLTGMSVLGKYLSKMKLNQYKGKTWADSEALSNNLNKKRAEAMGIDEEGLAERENLLKQQFEAGEISEAQYKTLVGVERQNADYMSMGRTVVLSDNPYNENNFMSEEELPDVASDLDEDDKLYLASKWGILYKPNEWIALEKLYEEFTLSFSITGAARLDTLKKICKTSLKMDQAIDCGDVDGFQKLSRVYDALMKSGKFTEAQRKEEKTSDFDCVGQIVRFAESKKGGGRIERHKITYPLDVIDETIDRLRNYYNELFNNDPSIRQSLENYLKKKESLQSQEADQKEAKAQGKDRYEITDEDLMDYRQAMEDMKDIDNHVEYKEV